MNLVLISLVGLPRYFESGDCHGDWACWDALYPGTVDAFNDVLVGLPALDCAVHVGRLAFD